MMTSPLDVALNTLAGQAYGSALACHGELGLQPEPYATRLLSVTRKYLGENLSQSTAFAFINRLHTDDLYLALACARSSEAAWERLTKLYRVFIRKVADNACSTADVAREIADSIPGHIFLPDASGCSRIASYEGRSSLAAWLSAVVNDRAVKEHRRCKNFEQIDNFPDIADHDALSRIEAALRAGRYASLIRDALIAANKSLSERERFILTLRYLDGLGGAEVASVLGVHPSTVSRRLQQIYGKLETETISTLGSKHNLNPAALGECLEEIFENSNYSVLAALKVDA